MEVTIKFVGGPLNGATANTSSLSQVRLFFPPRDRQVLAYVRDDELVYVFDPRISRDLTAIYDEAKERFGKESHDDHLTFTTPDPGD